MKKAYETTVEDVCDCLNLAFGPGSEFKSSDLIKVVLTDLDGASPSSTHSPRLVCRTKLPNNGLPISEARVSEIHAYLSSEPRKKVVVYGHDAVGPENAESKCLFISSPEIRCIYPAELYDVVMEINEREYANWKNSARN